MDKQRRWNIIILIVLFLIVIGRSILSPADTVLVHMQGGALEIKGPNQLEYQIPTDSIHSVELAENITYPQPDEESVNVVSGVFVNDQWGEYVLCVYPEISVCIVVNSSSGTYIFNYEDPQTTKDAYAALQEAL